MKNKSRIKPKISIIIPTKNAGNNFNEVLLNIYNQNYKNFEVIIIDSGSIDNTINIARKYHVKLVQIKPEEFGHGKTRNFGVSLSKGEIVVFLTHDAIPDDYDWLENLITPLNNKKIAGVYGRQIPKLTDDISDRYFYENLYPKEEKTWYKSNFGQGDNIFSSVNSAIRKELLYKYPFPHNIIVSEDYKWAINIMKKGYYIFYNPQAKVKHSNTYNDLYYLFRRNFDIGISYKSIFENKFSLALFKNGIILHINKLGYLIKNKHINSVPIAIIKDFIRIVGITLGKQEHLIPNSIKKKYLSDQKWYWI